MAPVPVPARQVSCCNHRMALTISGYAMVAPSKAQPDTVYSPTQSGYYQAKITTSNGCVATSDSTFIEFFPLPANPVWYNYNNALFLYDSSTLPAQYALQWYSGANPIPVETGLWYCTTGTGVYGLELTDLTTGCMHSYANLVEYNPLFDCTSGVHHVDSDTFTLVPNPASETTTVQLNNRTSTHGILRVWDTTGRLILSKEIPPGQDAMVLDLREFATGLFFVGVLSDSGKRDVRKLTVTH